MGLPLLLAPVPNDRRMAAWHPARGSDRANQSLRGTSAVPTLSAELAWARRRAQRPRHPRVSRSGARSPRLLCMAGLFLSLLATFALTSAGRIDIIDGQLRYEVAANWLDSGEPVLRDPALVGGILTVTTERGSYAVYNAGSSVTPMPLMLLSRLLPSHTIERDRFAFSMIGPIFGAAVAALLVLGYGMLGLSLARSIMWAAITSLSTLWWPGSVTVFDQNQHAFFLFTALLLAWHSGRSSSFGFAALAGCIAGLLVTFQESYILLLPLIGLPVLAKSPATGTSAPTLQQPLERPDILRYLVFALFCGAGLVLFASFNYWRFGALLQPKRYDDPDVFSGNPVAAFFSLLVSPGKSIFLFSPTVLLAFFGFRGLFVRAPTLVVTIGGLTIVHLLVVIQVAFFGGDWCWGPRYLLILVPLWALMFPFAPDRLRRQIVFATIGVGLVVQLMAISVDYQRFFFEHNLAPFFWRDQWVYFKRSQFLSRPGEIFTLLRNGIPAEARQFSPTPSEQITYAPFGPRNARDGSRWVRLFTVFHTPRPWPFWMGAVQPERRPVNRLVLGTSCAAMLVVGVGLIRVGLRQRSIWPLSDRQRAQVT